MMDDANDDPKRPADKADDATLEPAPAEEEGRLGHTGATHDDVKAPGGGIGTPSRRRVGEDPFGRPPTDRAAPP